MFTSDSRPKNVNGSVNLRLSQIRSIGNGVAPTSRRWDGHSHWPRASSGCRTARADSDSACRRSSSRWRCVIAICPGDDLLEHRSRSRLLACRAGSSTMRARRHRGSWRGTRDPCWRPRPAPADAVDALAQLLQFERAAGALLREVPEVHQHRCRRGPSGRRQRRARCRPGSTARSPYRGRRDRDSRRDAAGAVEVVGRLHEPLVHPAGGELQEIAGSTVRAATSGAAIIVTGPTIASGRRPDRTAVRCATRRRTRATGAASGRPAATAATPPKRQRYNTANATDTATAISRGDHDQGCMFT